ncbi:hypothetical protein SAMN04488589_2583 [Methanolobus vulcani]|uniref:HEAT repeat-containing protein n=1 Tax=Methanolobus vulcani TaxID=38026 RepID=A0A7Z7AYX1_9EURY|nr:HEAT repeat domain-containing protein [Methanolobus vulcani]SDG27220.1 hypothetical protein SAMN04488589_2583 [Methanolobus vulcani]
MKYYPTILILCTLLAILSGCIEDSSVDALINNLDHENVSIRNAAIENLSQIDDEDTISSLMQAANNNSNTVEKRKNAIKVLGTTGNNNASELLLNISLDEGEEKTVRMASIIALGEIGNKTMIYSLGNLSYGDDGLILYHAAYVFDQIEGNKENVYASYGKLPYPLSEEQRVYRNNLSEIKGAYRADGTYPYIKNATSILIDYNIKSGYIEISSDVKPDTDVMNEIYQIYDTEARKKGIYNVPVRFVRCGTIKAPVYWYNITDFNEFNITNLSSTD